MNPFRRNDHDRVADNADDESYEEAERNPQLIAAEEQVNHLPSLTRLTNPLIDPPSEVNNNGSRIEDGANQSAANLNPVGDNLKEAFNGRVESSVHPAGTSIRNRRSS